MSMIDLKKKRKTINGAIIHTLVTKILQNTNQINNRA